MTATTTAKFKGRFFCHVIAWICVICGRQQTHAQFLSQVRDEVRAESSGSNNDSPKPKRKRNSGSSSFCDDDDDGGFGDAFASAFGEVAFKGAWYAVTSPFWAPASIVEDDYNLRGYFCDYPYKHHLNGNLAIEPEDHGIFSSSLTRIRIEAGTNFDDISLAGGRILFDSKTRFGLDSEFNYRQEQLTTTRDDLWTGDLNLVYRFAQSPRVQMRTGIGMNWLADEIDSEFGFNFTYGGDFFPAEPWIISGEIDWGTLGRSSLFHGRTTLGFNFHDVEIYTGYDYFKVGDADVHSMVSGLRFWF